MHCIVSMNPTHRVANKSFSLSLPLKSTDENWQADRQPKLFMRQTGYRSIIIRGFYSALCAMIGFVSSNPPDKIKQTTRRSISDGKCVLFAV